VSTARPVVVTGAAAVTARGVLDMRECAGLLAPPAEPPAPRIAFEPGAMLDAARARRLDRAARLSTLVIARALQEPGILPERERVGTIVGSAFGGVDGSSAYMDRLFAKGPRLASPADFPNLVPSSPVGHASIYLGLRGPVFTVADLSASGEAAIAQAHELVAAGEADQVVGGAVVETSDIVERVFVALYARGHVSRGTRSEGAGAIVLEAEEVARARGAPIAARVARVTSCRDGASLASLRAPRDASRARVVAPAVDERLAQMLAGTAWESCARLGVALAAGEHEALGAIAAAAAVGAIAAGDADEILVVCAEAGRRYAVLLVR
jgi:3-oxoacyl-[acyl-carrier-protein] synthase II